MTLTLTKDSVETTKPQPSRGARQFGYLIGVGVGAAMVPALGPAGFAVGAGVGLALWAGLRLA